MEKPDFNKLPICIQDALISDFKSYNCSVQFAMGFGGYERERAELARKYADTPLTFILNLANRTRETTIKNLNEIDEFFRKIS